MAFRFYSDLCNESGAYAVNSLNLSQLYVTLRGLIYTRLILRLNLLKMVHTNNGFTVIHSKSGFHAHFVGI